MQRLCALIVWLIVGFAIVVGPGGVGPAHSEKQNKDQDKTNKKKSEASEIQKLPDKHSTSDLKQYCASVGGVFSTHIQYHGASVSRSGTGYMCQTGCGTGGCSVNIACDMSQNCWQQKGPRVPPVCRGGKRYCNTVDWARTDEPPPVADDILGSGPSLSVNGPSRTGTPKPAAPTPLPPPPPPSPNPG